MNQRQMARVFGGLLEKGRTYQSISAFIPHVSVRNDTLRSLIKLLTELSFAHNSLIQEKQRKSKLMLMYTQMRLEKQLN
jgi:hypothetical protein